MRCYRKKKCFAALKKKENKQKTHYSPCLDVIVLSIPKYFFEDTILEIQNSQWKRGRSFDNGYIVVIFPSFFLAL